MHYYNQVQVLRLTKRESQCLFYILRGLTAKSIAKKMQISFKTVEKFTQLLKEKFDCHYKSDLITKAIKEGMMHFVPPGIDSEEFSSVK